MCANNVCLSRPDKGCKDAPGGDFRLTADSPYVDAGKPLTRVRAAGRGAQVDVADAGFFSDGLGLAKGDTIRIGGSRYTVVKVDHDGRRLTVDRPGSWTEGLPVSLDYVGAAPDMGMSERGLKAAGTK